MIKFILTGFFLCLTLGIATFFYHSAQVQSTYEGLPTVPCLDYTKPIIQQFSFSLFLTIHGKNYPLDPTIGHDFGNCLHDIYVNDTSGTVYVKANDLENFTLGQFFDVWKKTFTPIQIFSYPIDRTHSMEVFVNGKNVDDYRNIILTPHATINVIYK